MNRRRLLLTLIAVGWVTTTQEYVGALASRS